MNLLDSERRVLSILLCLGCFVLGFVFRGPAHSAAPPVRHAPLSATERQYSAGQGSSTHISDDDSDDDSDEQSSRHKGLPRRDESAGAPYVLLGVVSYPPNFEQRNLLRRFSSESGGRRGDGRVPGEGPHLAAEYVFGDSYYGSPPGRDMQAKLALEFNEHGDAVFVNAREGIPNVGKASEKSAAWWLEAPKRSGARFFCKTDDDSLIHGAHLASALAAAEKAAGDSRHPLILLSYIRWRGWIPHYDFQACGGGWGGPMDAINQMEDPRNKCERAEGPFPQVIARLHLLSRATDGMCSRCGREDCRVLRHEEIRHVL